MCSICSFAAGYGWSNPNRQSFQVLQYCLVTEQHVSVSFWPLQSSEIITTSVKQLCLPCYTGNSDEILQLCCEADHLFCFWPCSLDKAQKSAFFFPQSLFKRSAMSSETLLCYFSGYFSIVHCQACTLIPLDATCDT